MCLTDVVGGVAKNFDLLEEDLTKQSGNRLSFFYGNKEELACNIVAKRLPFSKVALISSTQNFFKLGKILNEKLKRVSIKPVNIILESKNRFELGVAKDMFNLPEDVRAVMVVGKQVLKYATYFASLKNIPLIYVAENLDFFDTQKNIISVYDKNERENVHVDCEKIVVFDKEQLETGDFSLPYSYAVSKIVALYDYRINSIYLGESVDRRAYNLAKEGIFLALKAFELGGEKRNEKILKGAIKTVFADLLSGGKLFESFSATSVCEILGTPESVCAEFICSLYLLANYIKFTEKQTELPNFSFHIEEFCWFNKLNLPFVTKGVTNRLVRIKEKEKQFEKILNEIGVEAQKNSVYIPNILKRYYMLGGKNPYTLQSVKHALSSACFLGDGVNGLFFLFEKGYLAV